MKASPTAFRDTISSLIGPAYLPVFFYSLSLSASMPGFPAYLGGLGAGVAVIGLLGGMRGIGNLASDLPAGIILSKFGMRRVVFISLSITIVSNLALSFTTSIPVIGALLLVNGFFNSINITGIMAMVRHQVPPDQRGRALSVVGGAVRAGAMIGPLVGGWLADNLGMSWVFGLSSLLSAAGLISFLASFRKDRDLPKSDSSLKNRAKDLLRGLSDRWKAVVMVGLAVLLLSLLRSARDIVVPLWGEHIGLTATAIGVIVSASTFFELLATMTSGAIADKWGRRASLTICLGIFSIGLVALAGANEVWIFAVVSTVIAVGNGLGAGINMITGTDLAPNVAVSEFLGLWRLYGDIGIAGGPVVAGLFAHAVTLPFAVLLLAGLGFVGLAITRAGPDTAKYANVDVARQAAVKIEGEEVP